MAKTLPKYPADHQVGMHVPKGGSSCAKCAHVNADETQCNEKHFVGWLAQGNNQALRNFGRAIELPAPANEYCCDFFTTRRQRRTARDLRREK